MRRKWDFFLVRLVELRNTDQSGYYGYQADLNPYNGRDYAIAAPVCDSMKMSMAEELFDKVQGQPRLIREEP